MNQEDRTMIFIPPSTKKATIRGMGGSVAVRYGTNELGVGIYIDCEGERHRFVLSPEDALWVATHFLEILTPHLTIFQSDNSSEIPSTVGSPIDGQ